ncbi:MAG: rod shape-determining protein MreC [Cytophagales bacterium]|nr:rod shape-determining protein MreC [Cytophaga sp.]
MFRLLQFIFNIRVFLVFICLELFCIWCIVSRNPYQGAAYFSTSSELVGSTLAMNKSITEYFSLTDINQQLAHENAELKNKLREEIQKNKIQADTSVSILKIKQFNFSVARVINNSTAHENNFFTLDKGLKDGVAIGMGVVSPNGIAGQIKACTEHFSTAISVLNTKWSVSARVKNTKADGIIQWDIKDASIVKFTNVGRHHKIKVGDTIVTSGYKDALFPEGMLIGKITNISEEGGAYWNIDVKLATDYTALDYVFIIKNTLKKEIDSLETPFKPEARK